MSIIRRIHSDQGIGGYIFGTSANPWWHLGMSIVWLCLAVWSWRNLYPDVHTSMTRFAFVCWAAEQQFSIFLELVTEEKRASGL